MFALQSVVLVLAVSWASARPAEDVQIVESTIRTVRAAAPEDLLLAATQYGSHQDYGADDEDAVGYLKRFDDGGNDGYKHFDSYHKKDGDKYEYEKHTSFGKGDHAKYDVEDDKAGAGDKASYKVSEELNEGNDGDHYENIGESEKLLEGAEAEKSGEHAEAEDDGESAHNTDGEHLEQFDEGDSAKFVEGADEEDYY